MKFKLLNVFGAGVKDVGKFMDTLCKYFSLLNISADTTNGLHSLTDLMEMIHNFNASVSHVWKECCVKHRGSRIVVMSLRAFCYRSWRLKSS